MHCPLRKLHIRSHLFIRFSQDISWYGARWHDYIQDGSYELKGLFASHVSIFDLKGVIMLSCFELTIRMVWALKGINYIKWETISSTYVFATSEDEPARNNMRELQYYDLMVLDHHTWINVVQSMSDGERFIHDLKLNTLRK